MQWLPSTDAFVVLHVTKNSPSPPSLCPFLADLISSPLFISEMCLDLWLVVAIWFFQVFIWRMYKRKSELKIKRKDVAEMNWNATAGFLCIGHVFPRMYLNQHHRETKGKITPNKQWDANAGGNAPWKMNLYITLPSTSTLFSWPRLNIIFLLILGWKYEYVYIVAYDISVFECTWSLDGVWVMLKPVCRNLSPKWQTQRPELASNNRLVLFLLHFG